MQKLILVVLICLISLPVSAEKIRMWRDANGKLHFGDAPPSWSGSKGVAVTPQNNMGTYGGGDVVEQADRVREQWRERRSAPTVQEGLTYEERVRQRTLEMEKREIRDRMKNKNPSFGDSWADSEELRGVNRQLRDLERRRTATRYDVEGNSHEDQRELRKLEMEKREIRESRKNKRLSIGEGFRYDDEMYDINQRIRDIENRD
jgi:hypothetical protein